MHIHRVYVYARFVYVYIESDEWYAYHSMSGMHTICIPLIAFYMQELLKVGEGHTEHAFF
jgi:hypothetical protein